MSTLSSLAAEFAPHGALRAALNLGNPVLAHSRTATERPAGVSIDLARALAKELGVEVALVEFDTAAKALQALGDGRADIGFMAIDPLRAETIHFTPAYVHIEGAYLVRDASPLRANDEVDRAGHRIVVGAGSAYELYLSRHIAAAELVMVPTSEEVVGAMLREGHEVAAGVRQTLESESAQRAGLRVLPGRFMVIRQAMAMPKARSGGAAGAALDAFVERMKRSGFVAEALARHGIDGAAVADA